jgi:hypothetical protein
MAALAGLLLLAGCTGPTASTSTISGGLLGQPVERTETPAPTPAAHKPGVQPGSQRCTGADECKRMLQVMIESPDRGWIGQRLPADAYADGTRLFAYRALRSKLTCHELALAADELRAASKTLGGPAAGMAPDQVTRTRALSSQVEAELARERSGRCRT